MPRAPRAARTSTSGVGRARPTKDSTGSAADFLPRRPTLRTMRLAAQGCRGCELYKCGTRAVFGEGPATARVIFVGEQPGDVEDRTGHPFVGPAGKLFDAVLEDAGIDRGDAYLTNAVKHFKWARDARGKRRIHRTPSAGEVKACFPWLEKEIELVNPDVIVCLGAVAAKALLGRTFSVTKERGKPLKSPWAPVVFATVHPSSVLRAPSSEARHDARRALTADLRKVAAFLRKRGRHAA